jgi:hypothetical protein
MRGPVLRGTALVFLALCHATTVGAQQEDASAEDRGSPYLVELIGGVGGSAIGFGAVVLLTDEGACGENLSCTLGNAALALTAATMGSGVGAYSIGRTFDTEPSGLGVILGTFLGVVAAVGMDTLLANEMGWSLGDVGHTATVAITQGAITALGSRLVTSLRSDRP